MIHKGSISIQSQSDIDEITKITEITGYLFIENNAALTNLDGLSKIESVGCSLSIENNAVLTNVDGLSKLESIGNSLYIENNATLTNVDGLSKLESVGDLKGTVNDPIQIQLGSRHTIAYTLEEAIIGCECHTIAHWLKNYQTIGAKHNYTQKEIEEYLGYYNKVFGK